jgi:hypothetical protein
MSVIASFILRANAAEKIPSLESDIFAQSFIKKKWQEFDLELFGLKWFDYRFMTPLEATKEYLRVYGDVYRSIYGRTIDITRVDFLRVLSYEKLQPGLLENDPKAKANFTACWRGRQFADALGMPYKVYLEYAFTYRMRNWQRAYLPLPQHLYHEYDLERIQVRWEELQRADIWVADDPAYMSQNYCNAPAQNDYHEWLFKLASLRTNGPEWIARFVKEDRLPMQKAIVRLKSVWEREQFDVYLEQS